MDFKNKVLKYLSRGVLAKNDKFKNRHKGETCYIIGNGASLKNMDLAAFTDHIAFPLNFLCLHNDFNILNAPYYLMPAPSFLYPYVIGSYTGKPRKNIYVRPFLKAIHEYPDITVFTSLTNKFGFHLTNETYYHHHFGYYTQDINKCDISSVFSFMKGALHTGIGIAINMGFKKAILVGCDYAFTPSCSRHFYAAGPGIRTENYKNIYEGLLKETKGIIDIEIITDVGESRWMPYQSYESYTGEKIHYRENVDIVRPEYLDMLNLAYEDKQFTDNIY